MQILDGKATSKKILEQVQQGIALNLSKIGRPPRLDMILVGDSYASQTYVEMKEKKARSLGIDGVIHRLPESCSQAEIEALVQELNVYDRVDGFMIQLPLSAKFDQKAILELINPVKDVDGLTSANLGRLFQNNPNAIVSATPLGIKLLLEEYNIDVAGKRAVVIGRSGTVGLPTAAILNNMNATVTVTHSKTVNLEEVCREADILVAAVGKAGMVKAQFVKEGAIVIDVGINMGADGKPCGDVDFEGVKEKASYISPVPGGVGPMTIAALLWNVYSLWAKKAS
ncbi:MAG: bifunctional methylenetetrahydrofolate dehydrogenase/methenyltetrahydrofolate cyclohydrolase FolD [Candidatus Dojkabacteria bacterium]